MCGVVRGFGVSGGSGGLISTLSLNFFSTSTSSGSVYDMAVLLRVLEKNPRVHEVN